MTDLPEWALPIRDEMARAMCEASNSYEYERTGRIPSSFYDYGDAALAVALPLIAEHMAGAVESIDTFDRDVTVSAAGAIAVTLAASAIRQEATPHKPE